MKNLKLLPLNEIGIYQDTDKEIYNSKIVGLLTWEDQSDDQKIVCLRPISELDIIDGYIDLDENFMFLGFQK